MLGDKPNLVAGRSTNWSCEKPQRVDQQQTAMVLRSKKVLPQVVRFWTFSRRCMVIGTGRKIFKLSGSVETSVFFQVGEFQGYWVKFASSEAS